MAGEPPAKRGKYKTWMLDPNVPIPRTTKWRIFNTTKSSDQHRETRNVWLSDQEDQGSFEAANESDESDNIDPDEPSPMPKEIHIQVDRDMCSDYEETSNEEDDTSFTFSSESEPDETPDEIGLENVGNIDDEDDTLLYQNAGISKMAALLIFHLFVTEHKLSNHAMEDLIRLINALLPSGHKFVRSGYLLKKYWAIPFFIRTPPIEGLFFLGGRGGCLSKRKKNPEGDKKNSEGVKSFSSFSFYDLKNQKKKSSS